MKKLYTSSVFFCAGYAFVWTKNVLMANAPGFETEVPAMLSISCLLIFAGVVLTTVAYKLTPKI